MRIAVAAIVLVLLGAGCLQEEPAGRDNDAPESSANGPEASGADEIHFAELANALVRPGSKLYAPDDSEEPRNRFLGCTVNFVFLNQTGAVFVGTASHCLMGQSVGSPFMIAGQVAATIHYCSWGASDNSTICTDKRELQGLGGIRPGFEDDFALLEVAPDAVQLVHPAVWKWGGPTGLAGDVSVGDPVATYGNSGLRDAGTDGETFDAQIGTIVGVDGWTIDIEFETPRLPADSGSPVLSEDGGALAVIQTLGAASNGAVDLTKALASYEAWSGAPVSLATWSKL